MTIVRIAARWGKDPTLFRATPGRSGIWAGRRFTDDAVDPCDYLLVLNRPIRRFRVTCPPDRVWAVMMEPPNEEYKSWHLGDRSYARLYTNDPSARGAGVIHSHPCLTWSVDRDYDFLLKCEPPEKPCALSWIISNRALSAGHRKRLSFIPRLAGQVDFDLYGRGFAPLADKWDGLAGYRYSVAVENFANPHYWTEKLSDCFLAWTMPIYYGCTNITEYFPAESLIRVDIDDPEAPAKIRDAVRSKAWLRNREAIAHARDLVLHRYQFFAFMSTEIDTIERLPAERLPATRPPARLTVPSRIPQLKTLLHRFRGGLSLV